jgi:hypothetical protein
MESAEYASLRAELESLKHVAPERILAMYQEFAAESGKEVSARPTSFSRMIEMIIERRDARRLENHQAATL